MCLLQVFVSWRADGRVQQLLLKIHPKCTNLHTFTLTYMTKNLQTTYMLGG